MQTVAATTQSLHDKKRQNKSALCTTLTFALRKNLPLSTKIRLHRNHRVHLERYLSRNNDIVVIFTGGYIKRLIMPLKSHPRKTLQSERLFTSSPQLNISSTNNNHLRFQRLPALVSHSVYIQSRLFYFLNIAPVFYIVLCPLSLSCCVLYINVDTPAAWFTQMDILVKYTLTNKPACMIIQSNKHIHRQRGCPAALSWLPARDDGRTESPRDAGTWEHTSVAGLSKRSWSPVHETAMTDTNS